MTKKYAIVEPAFIFSGDGLGDLPWLFITPFHKIMYEQICGYSLGQNVIFFDDLPSAQKHFYQRSDKYENLFVRQKAIIEFELNDNHITRFLKIFEITHTADWRERRINPDDFTHGALKDLNKKYCHSKQLKEEKSFTRQNSPHKLGFFSKCFCTDKPRQDPHLLKSKLSIK